MLVKKRRAPGFHCIYLLIFSMCNSPWPAAMYAEGQLESIPSIKSLIISGTVRTINGHMIWWSVEGHVNTMSKHTVTMSRQCGNHHYSDVIMSVSNHQPHDCLPKRLFRRRSKKTSKLRVTGLCEGNSPVTGEFPAQRASNAANVTIWWRHHDTSLFAITVHITVTSQ